MGSEQILVVDDEPRILESINYFLEREGYTVSVADCGASAVDLSARIAFDLALVDISMPGLNGFEVMGHLLSRDPEMMVIMITGYASVESAVQALREGAWDYLKKPFEYADLIKTVKNALNQRRLIRENKEVLDRLEVSESRYRYMVNNSPDLIYTLDSDGCFTYTNDKFESILGYRKDELSGKSLFDIVHSDDLGQAATALSTCGTESYCYANLQIRFRKSAQICQDEDPYNCFVFVELTSMEMVLPESNGRSQGKASRIYGVARNITDRIHLEEQLRQSQKMEALGTLAGGIAHDFNNILMGIQGYTSLVRSSLPPDSPGYQKLANVDDYVHSGSEMTRQLLGFAQKNDRRKTVININSLLKMSARMFGRTKKDISIRQNLQKGIWSCQGDEGQIKQVLLNLYVNAWQAMPGGGHLYLKSENVVVSKTKSIELGLKSPGHYIKVSVVDTGEGIDRMIIDRIFDPFFTTKSRGGGTGIGLATAYGIIKSHGGAFRVLSKQGQGSSFSFFLPAAGEEGSRMLSANGKSKEAVLINGKGKVLLVDDEQSMVAVCSEMLNCLGYSVISATTGKEALEKARRESDIDLVVLDMVMPEMNGVEMFKQLRMIRSDLKILLSSGYNRQEDVEELLDLKTSAFIQKPYDINLLSEKLNAMMADK